MNQRTGGGTVPGSEALGAQTKFISETISEKQLISEINFKNVGFVNIHVPGFRSIGGADQVH